MSAPAALGRGLRLFALGRVANGVLGLLWLLLLSAQLPLPQLGVYFACLALFETLQQSSSLGVYFYAERRLPPTWAAGRRRDCAALVALLVGWRLLGLVVAATAAWLLLPQLGRWLNWPAAAPEPALFAAWLLVAGLARLVEVLLECMLQQGFAQGLNTLRGLARIGAVLALAAGGASLDTARVLQVELAVGLVYLGVAAAWLLHQGRQLRDDGGPRPPVDDHLDRRFAWHGWLALLVVQLGGADAIRLAVSMAAGPKALAVYGLAVAVLDMAGRHMPAALLYGYLRTWLTVQARPRHATRALWRAGKLLWRSAALVVLAALALWWPLGPDLARALAPGSDTQALHRLLLLLLPVLLLQTLRLLLSLASHLRGDNQSVLHANLATLPVPAVVALLVSTQGVVAAAIGPWLLELLLVWVLARRQPLPWARLMGRARLWRRAAALALGALLLGLACRLLLPAPWSWPLAAVVVMATLLLGAAAWLRPERDERHLLRALWRPPA
jgi:hypothetical protein